MDFALNIVGVLASAYLLLVVNAYLLSIAGKDWVFIWNKISFGSLMVGLMMEERTGFFLIKGAIVSILCLIIFVYKKSLESGIKKA